MPGSDESGSNGLDGRIGVSHQGVARVRAKLGLKPD